MDSDREPLMLLVEEDWRMRRFLCTVLKYATKALVIEAADAAAGMARAAELDRPIDLLICGAGAEGSGIALARALAAGDPAMPVLLLAAGRVPPSAVPSGWRLLEVPFQTAAFLECVSELCCPVAV